MLFEKYKEYKQVNEVLSFLKLSPPLDNKQHLLDLQSIATSLQKNLEHRGNLIFHNNKYSF